MRRKLMLPALAACALLAVSAPAATAKPHKAYAASIASKLSEVSGQLKALQKAVSQMEGVNKGQTTAISTVDGRVNTVVSNLAGVSAKVDAIIAGVPAITAALTALKDGLTAINAALQNTTTGLVGLNLARPQFGIYSSAGTFLGGTGTVGSGPKANVLGTAGNAYVVDFGNDVSKRVYSVNVFAGVSVTNTATNCSAPGVGSTCGALQGAGSDASPNHVLVTFSGAPSNGWSVTAISG